MGSYLPRADTGGSVYEEAEPVMVSHMDAEATICNYLDDIIEDITDMKRTLSVHMHPLVYSRINKVQDDLEALVIEIDHDSWRLEATRFISACM